MSSPPVPYDRQANFTDWSSTHPGQQQPGVDLDKEFDAIRTALNKEISRLLEIQRSDGKLANAIVTRDSLAADVPLGFGAPTTWAANTDYAVNSTVFYDAKFWLCNTAHTSGAAFAANAAKFSLIADLGSGAVDAAASALAAAASATAALNSANAAHASELAAAASAAAAAAFDSSLYLTKANNLAAVANPATALANLGARIGTLKIFSGGADPAATAQAGDIWTG